MMTKATNRNACWYLYREKRFHPFIYRLLVFLSSLLVVSLSCRSYGVFVFVFFMYMWIDVLDTKKREKEKEFKCHVNKQEVSTVGWEWRRCPWHECLKKMTERKCRGIELHYQRKVLCRRRRRRRRLRQQQRWRRRRRRRRVGVLCIHQFLFQGNYHHSTASQRERARAIDRYVYIYYLTGVLEH